MEHQLLQYHSQLLTVKSNMFLNLTQQFSKQFSLKSMHGVFRSMAFTLMKFLFEFEYANFSCYMMYDLLYEFHYFLSLYFVEKCFKL